MTISLMTFQEALSASERYSRRHLLLGNGFSIACRPSIFQYGRLFERADFSRLSDSARTAFQVLDTQDFERVIKALRDASTLIPLYSAQGGAVEAMRRDADGLREVIADSHPAYPGEITEGEYTACREFLSHFSTIYSLNYDLLLYWVLMHTQEGEHPTSDDGFRKPEDDFSAAYVTWEPSQSHEQNTWFLHGALHVFDAGTEVQKFTWINTGVRLIDQIRDALQRNYFPLFVAEGTSDEKLERIKHSDYLAKAYRSFCEIQYSLFVFGHALAENDEHYLRRIERGKLRHLFVGIYGDSKSADNRRVIARAEAMSEQRPSSRRLIVDFYEAATARVWGTERTA